MRRFSIAAATTLLLATLSGLSVPAVAAAPVCSTPTISPTTKLVGDQLTVSVTCSNSPTSYSYQWSASPSSTGTFTNISGATSASLTVPASTGGMYLKVTVSASNSDGTSSQVSSLALGRILFPSAIFAGENGNTSYVDAQGTNAKLGRIADMTTDGRNIYFVDSQNHRVRQITPNGDVTTIAGDGQNLRVDGVGTSASFATPSSVTYESATNSLIIGENGSIRLLALSTGQVTTMRNRAEPISYSQSGTTVTLVFASDHGIESGSTLEISNLDPNFDGTATGYFVSNTSIRFTASLSQTVASTPVSGATVETKMGYPTSGSNYWGNFYSATEVSPDGRFYLGRANYGSSNNERYLLRFTRISGNVFSYERLFSTSVATCDISFEDANTLYIQTCGSIVKATTTDDWATRTTTSVRTSVNAGSQLLPDGMLYAEGSRTDLTASPTTTLQYWAGTITEDLKVVIGDNLYVADDFGSIVYKISGLGTGDSTAPSLATSVPTNGATAVATSTTLTLNFDENIFAAVGKNLTLVNESDANQNEVLAANSGAVVISGSTATITPSASLADGTRYHVLIDSGAFTDAVGNPFAGIASTTALVFDTAAAQQVQQPSQTPSQSSPAPYSGPVLHVGRQTAIPGGEITLTGEGFSTVTSASINGLAIRILALTDGVIQLQLPASIEAGVFDLVLLGSFGKLTVQDALQVTQRDDITSNSEVNFCKEQSNGTVKMYALDPVGAGKIQFLVDGVEIAWVRALSDSDPKLRVGDSGSYFVRTVTLSPGQSQTLEIVIDGKITWSNTYGG